LPVIVTQTVSYSVLEMHISEGTFPCGFFVLQSSGYREKKILSTNACDAGTDSGPMRFHYHCQS